MKKPKSITAMARWCTCTRHTGWASSAARVVQSVRGLRLDAMGPPSALSACGAQGGKMPREESGRWQSR